MEHHLAIIILGSPSVGKTALMTQFVEKNFVEPQMHPGSEYQPYEEPVLDPDGVEVFRARAVVDGTECLLNIRFFPTEAYPFVPRPLVQKAEGFLIVYSVTSRSSFEEAALLRKEVEAVKDPCQIVLVGNKCDLDGERQVREQEGRDFAAIEYPFFETSAKNAINIEEAFNELIRMIREGIRENRLNEWKRLNPVRKY